MWVCGYCHKENKDAAASCISCGRVKTQRRFASAPTRANRYANEQTNPYGNSDAHIGIAPNTVQAPWPPAVNGYSDAEPCNHAQTVTSAVRPLCCGFARIVGMLLCIGLPLLVAAIAWGQYEALSAALVPLFLKGSSPEWTKMVVYIVLCLFAVLLSLLPGLWTLLKIPSKRCKREEASE